METLREDSGSIEGRQWKHWGKTMEALREDSGSIRRKRSWQVAGFVNFQELSQIDRSGRAAEAVAAQRSEFVQCS